MFISVSLLSVFALASGVTPPASANAGGAIYEVSNAQCAAYFDPKSAPTPESEPYRGESLLRPIDASGAVIEHRVMRFPPSFPIDTAPSGFRATAKGEFEVNPAGDVVRAKFSSADDARFAVHAVSQVAFWRFKPVPTGKLCRKIQMDFEWKID